jgi:cytochrome P450
MRLSTRTHAAIDYATVGAMLVFPRLFGASQRFTNIVTTAALLKLGYTLVTRHEGGVIPVLPMQAHLALDKMSGIGLAALPCMLGEEDNVAAAASAKALGIFDVAAAAVSDTEMREESQSFTVISPGYRARVRAAGAHDNLHLRGRRIPSVSALDSLKVAARVILPTVAKGPIKRRPTMVALAEQQELDTIAVQTLQKLRAKYGPGPLMLPNPVRHQALLLDPQHVRRVLDESPDPFSLASTEKQAALAHFEPQVSLISQGAEREVRRTLNEQVLEQNSPVHHMAQAFLPIVDEEAQQLLQRCRQAGELRWDEFFDTWFCIVRRVVFGNSARNDRRITDLMSQLRSDGNWAVLKPQRTDLRDELHTRIRQYIERAEPGSLAAYMASKVRSEVQSPEQQIPQWLFAFDPAAMATFRALALLARHPDQMARAQEEASGGIAVAQPHRPFLRACVLEALRLWPTTPLLLRQSTRETEWGNGIMPANTGILIYAPFFHRDDEHLPYAHLFNPNLWIEDDANVKGDMPRTWALVPFSGGPGQCPGRNLVLLLTSGMLAALIGNRQVHMKDPQRLHPGMLAGTLNHFTLRFDVGPATTSPPLGSPGSYASRSAATASGTGSNP